MNERIIYSACPLCASKNIFSYKHGDCSSHPLYDVRLKKDINWSKCQDCEHVFTEGYYAEEACKIIFSKTNTQQKIGGDLENYRQVSARMIEKVLPFAAEGCWLDVGFGNGSLLFTVQEFGFTPIGLDLRADNVNIMNQLGIKAFRLDITELVLDEECAVISMADVLEHLPYPGKALAAAYKLLKKGGVLFISMPNSESILWEAMNKQNANPYWGNIEHYHNFSRSRLYALLKEYGFLPRRYGVSERYRVCMEVVAERI